MKKPSISIASDHAGFDLKQLLVQALQASDFTVKDFGPHNTDSADYPDYAHPVARSVESGVYDVGILICGSGIGMCMAANKHQGVRAALAWNTEISKLSRMHNNANVLCMPARFIDTPTALSIVDAFISTQFEGGRHEKRVDKISNTTVIL